MADGEEVEVPRIHPNARYTLVTTNEQLDQMCAELDGASLIGFDTETSGLDFHADDPARVCGLCFSTAPHTGYYIPIRHEIADGILDPRQLDATEVLTRLQPYLETKRLVGHNAKFDWQAMFMEGIVCNFVDDTIVMASMSGDYMPGRRGLKDLTYHHFGIKPLEIHEVAAMEAGKKPKKSDIAFHKYDIEECRDYAAADADWTLQLWGLLRPRLAQVLDHPAMGMTVYEQIEMPLLPVVARMELAGVPVDVDFLTEMGTHSVRMMNRVETATKKVIWEMLGEEIDININSVQQISKLFTEQLPAAGYEIKLPIDKKTKEPKVTATGNYSFDNAVMVELAKDYPWVDRIITYKSLRKLHSSFLKKMPGAAWEGRIYANFNQVGTDTGRFSSSKPNLQQIPKDQHFYVEPMTEEMWTAAAERNEIPVDEFKAKVEAALYDEDVEKPADQPTWVAEDGTMFSLRDAGTEKEHIWESWVCRTRNAIKAKPGKYIIEADYSQIELRVFAGESEEPALMTAFETGEDVHSRTASVISGVPVSEVTKKQRSQAKTVNFGIIYGATANRISESEGIPYEEAQTIVNNYFASLPRAEQWINDKKSEIRQMSKVYTKFGRVRSFHQLLQFGSNSQRGKIAMAEREGVNAIVQGTAADIMKLALIRLPKWLAARHSDETGPLAQLVMTVHDSIVLEVDESIPVHEIVATVKDAMVFPIEGYPPIVVDAQAGPSWGEGVEIEDGEQMDTPRVEDTNASPTVWVLEMHDEIARDQLDGLRDFLRSRQANDGGRLRLLFHRESQEPTVNEPDGRFRLDFRDSAYLRRIVGECQLHQDAAFVDSAAVFEGIDDAAIFEQ